MKTTNRETIRSIAEERDVFYLLHFTEFSNLREIVKHGLLSRNKLKEPECMAHAHAIDPYRLDGRDDAISVSISRVNRPVFASKRHKSGHTDWVVLVLPSNILWTHNCLFAWSNAAKKEITYLSDSRRRGAWAFKQMFVGSNGERNGHALCEPTHLEAEVQVLDPIAPDYILAAFVDRREMVESVKAVLACLPGESRPVEVEIDAF